MTPVARPKIVCLCGSTRFYDAFQRANYDETMAGRIVLSVGFYPHSTAQTKHGEGIGHDSAEKIALDELHKRKIDLADEILVLNVGGYVGDSTRSEIEYAEAHGKPVRWLEPHRERVEAKGEAVSGNNQLPSPSWLLALNQYQRDNLLACLKAIMHAGEHPFNALNTGDWVGEIRWMLGSFQNAIEPDEGNPNVSSREMIAQGRKR